MAESKKKLMLVVDDDDIMRNGMRTILESLGHEVHEAVNGKEAIAMITNQTYTLIVSDFEMPQIDGVQLLRFVKQKTPSRFLLLSEFSTALQSRQAYQLGADGFLNKPFNKEDFLKAILMSLSKKEGDQVISDELDYIQVPLVEFITGSVLKVDLYLRISSSKYLKIGNKGAKVEKEQFEAYLRKGVTWLYMRKEDFALYVGYNIALAQKVHNNEGIEYAKKIRLTMHITETLISQLRSAGLNRQQLEDTSNVVMNAVELVLSSKDTLKLLESMEVNGALPAHSVATSIWACLIAKQMNWSGHSTFFKIAICSIFHDVGTKEIDESLLNKPRFELSRTEVKVVEGHTTRGRDILQSVPGMPEDAPIVALQHHEMYRGNGYPYGLKFQQVHPLALLIGLADRFCEILKDSGGDPGISHAFEQLNLSRRDFAPEYFNALLAILQGAKIKTTAKQPGQAIPTSVKIA